MANKDKKMIGDKCSVCGKTEDLQYHHIVPRSMGGSDDMNNMQCVCYQCHQIIHYGKIIDNCNHSELVKNGQKNAIKNGIKMGAKRLSIQDGDPCLITELFRFDMKLENTSIIKIAKKYNASREKMYRYLHIYKGERYHSYFPYDKYCSIIYTKDFDHIEDKTRVDILLIGDEWNEDDKYDWIKCIKDKEKLRVVGVHNVYFDVNECNAKGYEFIIKYNMDKLNDK